MSPRNRILAGAAFALAVASVALVFALFRGCFDRGRFEIKASSWNSAGKVAIVAERSDDEAMSGDQYFVIVGDHVLSPEELRAAYYASGVVFRADDDCLTVRWNDPHDLTIRRRGASIDSDHIAVQRHRAGDVTVDYEDIPLVPGKD